MAPRADIARAATDRAHQKSSLRAAPGSDERLRSQCAPTAPHRASDEMAPPFGNEWTRAHLRIRPYLNREDDFFYVKLMGSNERVLLDTPISYAATAAHDAFYKDFFVYLRNHLESVNRSALSERELDCLRDSLLGLVACCKKKALPLPTEVSDGLFEGLDHDDAQLQEQKEKIDKDLIELDKQKKELRKRRLKLNNAISAAKRCRASLDGKYRSDTEHEESESEEASDEESGNE